jgi:CelD/BcsL family acetyltransferase involved in cellulose biosynthesis
MIPSQRVSQAREPRQFQGSLENRCDWCPLVPEVTGSNYSIQIATTLDAIETLRPTWRKWAHSLDTDIDYFLHDMAHDPESLRPYVITVCNEGVPQAMLIGKIKRRRVACVVSFVNILGPSARVLEIKKGARIGRPSAAIDELFALELLRAAKNGQVDSVCFERLPLHSELFHQVQRLPSLLVKERVPHVFCYSVLSLTAPERKRPRVFSGKARREIRRKTRIVERAFPNQTQLKCFSDVSELDAGMCDAMRVAVTTWQYFLGAGLTDTAQTRETFRFLAHQGWLRIYVLYIEEVPCAFLVGQLYNNIFYCQYAGYNPSFTQFSVGSLLTARAFEDLAAAGVSRVDLGEGGQEHNRRLGCRMSEEGTVHVYAPTLRGLWLNVFFGTTYVVRAGGRRTRSALRLDLAARVWKKFLTARWAARRASKASGSRLSR